ncbi:4-aminobutyrate--2-oxoglutarate transaminase [Chondrinema litorale]|uniref:4-aminobutyrate--2-oxoglutarate transaminase n=1 Tax=Chondrinema litorale TaxID=2994555 RepID=UPI0025430830|nr:4-aminobutyrate--2-oxoglutarate transaminase [Chondrinema litorale]UZR97999.1 4-aminobutyrate--2-oxoglutarate transaminase [Chondrinema litorale]
MSNAKDLIERRKNVVPQGVGIFNPATVSEAKDGIIIDADGNEMIDFAGGIGVLNAGHCPAPVVKAIQQQAEKLIHACFHVGTYEPYVALAEKLTSLFPHGAQTKAMLTNTGAESVENAIKIARQATGRQAVICFTGAFHGRSMMAMSLTSKVAYKTGCGPFAPEVYRVQYPNYYKNQDGLSQDEFSDRELFKFKKALVNMVDSDNVAAVIIEPVQGEGGFNVTPKKYLQGLRDICTQHGIMLIIDEVQSGFARTGKWAAYQHYGITPDISTWAKSMGSGMPIGAVVGKAEIMDKARPGTIGGTYLGNPVSCAAALATIKFIDEQNLNDRAVEIGQFVTERFEAMQKKTDVIGDIRGLGAMNAIELVKDGNPTQPDADLTAKLVVSCFNRGLIILSAGTFKNVIRILSPLVITNEQLDKGLNILEEELMKLTSMAEPAI